MTINTERLKTEAAYWDKVARDSGCVSPGTPATICGIPRPTKPSAPEWPDMPDRFYEGLGWMHAECCAALDAGEDPRDFEIGEMVQRCIRDLTKEQRVRDELARLIDDAQMSFGSFCTPQKTAEIILSSYNLEPKND